jgi:DNA-binding transcriptional MerR regulator
VPRNLIGKASKRSGFHPNTLRRLDKLGVVIPARDLAGRRVYSDDQIRHLRQLAGVERRSTPTS